MPSKDNFKIELSMAIGDFLSPLRSMTTSLSAIESMFYEFGWDVTFADVDPNVSSTVAELFSPFADALDSIDRIRTRATELHGLSDVSLDDVDDLFKVSQSVRRAFKGIVTFKDQGFPEPFNSDEFWKSFGRDLSNDLVGSYFRTYHPSIYAAGILVGIFRIGLVREDSKHRVAYKRTSLDFSVLGRLLKDPSESWKTLFEDETNVGNFDYPKFLTALELASNAIKVPTKARMPSLESSAGFLEGTGFEILETEKILRTRSLQKISKDGTEKFATEFEVGPTAEPDGTKSNGIYLRFGFEGNVANSISLGENIKVSWEGNFARSDAIGLIVQFGSLHLFGARPEINSRFEIVSTSDKGHYLLGEGEGSIIHALHPSIALDLIGDSSSSEIALAVALLGDSKSPGLRTVLELSGFGAFLKKIFRRESVDFSFSPRLLWSSRDGFSGQFADQDFEFNLNSSVGPVCFTQCRVGFTEGSSPARGFVIKGSIDASVILGPVQFSLSNFGINLETKHLNAGEFSETDSDSDFSFLGDIGVRTALVTPNAIGISISSGASFRGGGFLQKQLGDGEYKGVLDVQVGKLSIKALGLLKEGSDDWSLLLLVYTQFPSIQLGFGFTLDGVGGLIGLQHGVATQQLIDGLKTKAYDDVLFPENPVVDAARILSRLKTLFPPTPGAMTFAPMFDLGWGTPRFVFIRVGIVVQLDHVFDSGPVSFSRAALIGQVKVLLGPTKNEPEKAVVKLVIDVLGFWDREQKRYGVIARLRDSKVAGIDISGSLVIWGEYGQQSRFILAAGGFNPRFKDVPSEIAGVLDRLTASFKVGRFNLALTGYFAVTPCTIQFGVDLLAQAKIGSVGIEGNLGFDALVYREPTTHFIVDFRIYVGITYRGRDLAAVRCVGVVEGPGQWHLKGRVTFSILWWDIDKSFDEQWGSAPAIEAPPINVSALLAAELARKENWTAQLPQGTDAMVSLAPSTNELTTLAHPIGRAVFTQRVVPLGLDLQRYGSSSIMGPKRFDITGLTVGEPLSGASAIPLSKLPLVREQFARAQFLEMSEEDRYSKPSFEAIDAGIEFSNEAYAASAAVVADDLDFETKYMEFDENGNIKPPRSVGLGVKVGTDFRIQQEAMKLSATAKLSKRHDERQKAKKDQCIVIQPVPLASASKDALVRQTTLSPKARFSTMIAEQQILSEHMQLCEEFELT